MLSIFATPYSTLNTCGDLKTLYASNSCCGNLGNRSLTTPPFSTLKYEADGASGAYTTALTRANFHSHTLPLTSGHPEIQLEMAGAPFNPVVYSTSDRAVSESFGGEPFVHKVWERALEWTDAELQNLLGETSANNYGLVHPVPKFNGKHYMLPYTGWAHVPVYNPLNDNLVGKTMPSTMNDFFDFTTYPGPRGFPWWGEFLVLTAACYAMGVPPSGITTYLETPSNVDLAIAKLGNSTNYRGYFGMEFLGAQVPVTDPFTGDVLPFNHPNIAATSGGDALTMAFTFNALLTTYPRIWDGVMKDVDWLSVNPTPKDPTGAEAKKLIKHMYQTPQVTTMSRLVNYDPATSVVQMQLANGALGVDKGIYPMSIQNTSEFTTMHAQWWHSSKAAVAQTKWHTWLANVPGYAPVSNFNPPRAILDLTATALGNPSGTGITNYWDA